MPKKWLKKIKFIINNNRRRTKVERGDNAVSPLCGEGGIPWKRLLLVPGHELLGCAIGRWREKRKPLSKAKDALWSMESIGLEHVSRYVPPARGMPPNA